MGILIGIVVAVIAVAAIAFFAMRSRGAPALTDTAEPRRPEPQAKPAPRPAAPKPEAAKPEAPAARKPSEPKMPAVSADAPPPPRKPSEPKMAAVPADAPPPPPRKPSEPKMAAVSAEGRPSQPKLAAVKPDGREQVAALKKGLASTRGGFIARLARIFGGKKEIDPELLEQLQEVLLTADIGVRTSEKMLEKLRGRQGGADLGSEEAVWQALREEARGILGASGGGLHVASRATTVIVVGVNGVGKTTTIGKLASRLQESGRKVVLAAGDTFRAAAVSQLEVWGRRVGCDVVKGKDRADPSSVVFDAIKKAQADAADVVIIDTAGRLHTKSNLMEELKKVVRTAEKALERPVDEILLVLDATTGQNAIQQAHLFKEAIPVSGIVLTKLDGTAKGGVVLGIVDEHQIPVRYVGIGERVEDLREFDGDSFVQALFARPEDETAAA